MAEDGREIEFDTFDFPDHVMRPGQELWHPIDRLLLCRLKGGCWEVKGTDGLVREFAPVLGRTGGGAMVQTIRSLRAVRPSRPSTISGAGSKVCVTRAGGSIGLSQDDRGRIFALTLPLPQGEG